MAADDALFVDEELTAVVAVLEDRVRERDHSSDLIPVSIASHGIGPALAWFWTPEWLVGEREIGVAGPRRAG